MLFDVRGAANKLVMRTSKVPENEQRDDRDERVALYKEEIRLMRRMDELGIGPRIYVFTEKLDMSLFDAEFDPPLLRKAFVDADCESALVDLYARSSRVFRCVDTKSQNVLFTPGERSADGLIETAPRIVMIDMDMTFCEERERQMPHPSTAPTTIHDIELRLKTGSSSTESAHLDAACISLLIHCICSMRARPRLTRAYGFPSR